jgi:T-complex protein 1 subunit alpha
LSITPAAPSRITSYFGRRFPSRADTAPRESEITLERVRKILATGANVILTTKGIDDLCLKEFVEAGAMAVRRCRKEDLRRIARATGATLVSSLANLEGDETFEAANLGFADEVVQERISDDELILVKGTKVVSSSSIILRGANDYMLDEMERALHDALSIVKRTLESGSVVPGGGAVETALSIYLENFATTLVSDPPSASQMLSILVRLVLTPRSGLARTTRHWRIRLGSPHHPQNPRHQRRKGLDRPRRQAQGVPQRRTGRPAQRPQTWAHVLRPRPAHGEVVDNRSAGVLEPTISKIKSLKSALEAATSLLRIDDSIQVAPEQKEEQDPHGH